MADPATTETLSPKATAAVSLETRALFALGQLVQDKRIMFDPDPELSAPLLQANGGEWIRTLVPYKQNQDSIVWYRPSDDQQLPPAARPGEEPTPQAFPLPPGVANRAVLRAIVKLWRQKTTDKTGSN